MIDFVYNLLGIDVHDIFAIADPSPEPWDEWREKVDIKLKEVREMMKSHERACDQHNVSSCVYFCIVSFEEKVP